MSTAILDAIPFAPNLDDVLHQLRIRPASDDAATVEGMLAAARAVARPQALCHVGVVERHSETSVAVDGVTLSSRVLRVNLDQVHRVFVFLATCGGELEAWAADVEGLLERYWADAIMELALRAAIDALTDHINERYAPGPLSMMNPGSLDEWPMSAQRSLFELLGTAPDAIGVQLSDSLLMRPTKSVSGVLFASEDGFQNCQLCPIERCPNRRAPYEPARFEQRYRTTG